MCHIFILFLTASALLVGPASGQSYQTPTYQHVFVNADRTNGTHVVRKSYLDAWFGSVLTFVPGSTTGRTAAVQAAEVINARDYGLVCDGTTDNANAFAAIDVKAASAAGQTVYFPPAALPCMTSAAMSPPSNTTYRADPGTVTIKPTPGNTAGPMLFSVASKSNVLVDGLTFDGGGKDFNNASTVVQIYSSTNVVFDHAAFQNTRGIAFLVSQSNKTGVRSSLFTNNGNRWKTTFVTTDRIQAIAFCCGITAANVGNFVTDNSFTDVGLDAISATRVSNFTVTGNRCELANNQRALVTSTEYAACIYIASSDSLVIANNYSAGASGNGIDLFTNTNVTVTGNHMIGGGATGIGVFATSRVTVVGNTTMNNAQWSSSPHKGGITLSLTTNDVTISGNISSDNQATKSQAYGVHVLPDTTGSNIWIDRSNMLAGNLTGAIGGLLTDYSSATPRR